MAKSKQWSRNTLREQLDDLEACLNTCLLRVRDQSAFMEMTKALCAVCNPIVSMLTDALQGYKVELPISYDEHLNINWIKESEKFRKIADEFRMHEFADEITPPIVDKLEELCKVMELVKHSFQALMNSDLFADYCVREYRNYLEYRWDEKLDEVLDEINEDFTTDEAFTLYEERMNMYLGKLAEVAPKAVEIENRIVYYEPLGHKIWGMAHRRNNPQKTDDTLWLLAAADYFSKESGLSITYLPKKINPNQANQEFDGLSPAERLMEMNKQKVALIKSNRLDNLIHLTNRTAAYYGAKIDMAKVDDLYRAMFENEDLIEEICEKFSERNRINSICRIVGEIKAAELYKLNTKAQELANIINTSGSPDKASRAKYIREHFNSEDKLGIWIRERLTL